jgi:transcriptional regulator with XRE-family HTH domain
MHVLRDLREERGLTLRELAGRAGVSVATVLRAEHGDTAPYGRTLHKLARVLAVPVATLRHCGPPEPGGGAAAGV